MTNELATTTNRLSILDEKISIVADQLRPSTEDAIAARLLALQNSGMKFDPNIKNGVRAYGFALKGLPHVALKIVSEKLVQGAYPRQSQAFIPIPSELAALVRQEARGLSDEMARLKATREAIAPPAGVDPDELDRQRARIRELHADYKAQHVATRLADAPPELSDDDANRLFRNKRAARSDK